MYEELLQKAPQYLTISAWKRDLLITKAEGSKIWLNDQPCLDFVCGPGVSNIGHSHPEVLQAVKDVYDKKAGGYGGNMLLNQYEIKLAEVLHYFTPGHFPKKVFFSNSGGEAVEAAIFTCLKRRPERRGMITFLGDFHGRLGNSRTATTSRPLHVEGLPWGAVKPIFLIFPSENPETPEKKEFMDNFSTARQYLNYVENAIEPFLHEINFALFELIQGEGGINVARKEMVQALVGFLKEHNIPVIIDEVQSGLARTGKMWASEIYEIEPDIMTVAKALSGGVVPIGATIMREDLAFQEVSEHCNTFGGNPPACAAGLKVLEIIERENLAEKSETKGQFLEIRLRLALADNLNAKMLIHDISGRGLMRRIALRDPNVREEVMAESLKRGLFLMTAGKRSIRLMPPLIISNEEMEQAVQILVEAIREVGSKINIE